MKLPIWGSKRCWLVNVVGIIILKSIGIEEIADGFVKDIWKDDKFTINILQMQHFPKSENKHEKEKDAKEIRYSWHESIKCVRITSFASSSDNNTTKNTESDTRGFEVVAMVHPQDGRRIVRTRASTGRD